MFVQINIEVYAEFYWILHRVYKNLCRHTLNFKQRDTEIYVEIITQGNIEVHTGWSGSLYKIDPGVYRLILKFIQGDSYDTKTYEGWHLNVYKLYWSLYRLILG